MHHGAWPIATRRDVNASVQDIEWDYKNNFLGFSVNGYNALAATELQGRWRVNFLKFDHDDTFVKVPYNQENSRLMNVPNIAAKKPRHMSVIERR